MFGGGLLEINGRRGVGYVDGFVDLSKVVQDYDDLVFAFLQLDRKVFEQEKPFVLGPQEVLARFGNEKGERAGWIAADVPGERFMSGSLGRK